MGQDTCTCKGKEGCDCGKELTTPPKQVGLTTTQKWFAVIGLTIVAYYILYKNS